MRKYYFLLFLLVTGFTNYAQVSITATAGTPGPVVYSSLKAGFDAINAGTHKGVIGISITGNTTETSSAVLNASGTGSSSYTIVSIKPSGGARAISGDLALPLIDLDGADHVVIDGLNSGGNSLTVSNVNTSATASTIRLINDASTDTIRNTTILGSSSATATGTIFISNGLASGNNNNMISNCDISDAGGNTPANGIYSSCTTGQENSGITISNNTISNFFNPGLATAGILLAAGNTTWTIFGNRFFQTTVRTFTSANTHRAIQLGSGNGYLVSSNTIGYSSAAGTGVYTITGAVASRFIAIDLAVGAVVASNVQGNNITHFSYVSSYGTNSFYGAWCGIYISTGDVNVGTLTGNNIGSTSGTGDITVMTTVSGGLAVPISLSGSGNVNIANNTIGSLDLLPSGALSGNLPGILVSGTLGNISITNNTIGNSTPNNMRIGTAGVTTGNGVVRGILNSNTGNVSIISNTIRNLVQNSNNALALFRGIEYQNGTGIIANNSLSNISANGTSNGSFLTHEGIGIIISTALAGVVVEGNTIANLGVTNTISSGVTVSGIYMGTINNITVTRNKIYGFYNASSTASTTFPPVITGIFCRDAAASSTTTISNNMISFGTGQATNTAIIGIWNQISSAVYTTRIYYNSVNIEGTVTTGAQPTFGYYRGDFVATFTGPVIDIKNNIFNNNRIGGTGKHYAIANAYGNAASSNTGWPANASDYNVLNAGETIVAYWSGDKSFSSWQTASAGDSRSLSSVPVTFVNAATDLHLAPTANALINGKATPATGFTVDIDNEPRSESAPDPGADEFNYDPLPITMEYFKGIRQGVTALLSWKASCSGPSVFFQVERSADARKFTPINSFAATGVRCIQPFDVTDNRMANGVNYYRLKMTEPDGSFTYSAVIALLNKETGIVITGLTATSSNEGYRILHISSAQNTKAEIVISNASGQLVTKQPVVLLSGTNDIPVASPQLFKGAYQVSVFTAAGNSGTSRFIVL